ncbi:MAG: TetR/AcrR family transcriptional regulator [Myxococcaceae bacterium]|nr:TetR/AcrR family transcriptional regulator [Myxococcaceae bacterium]
MTRKTRRTRGVLGGRSDEVVRRVLDAALVELASSGYAAFRMEAVAEAAEVNKTTVYRRWPARAQLIASLLERLQAPLRAHALPDTGSLEGDLVEAFTHRARVARTLEGRAWRRLLAERLDPELAPLLRTAIDGRGGEWKAMVTRGIGRRELPEGTDVQRLFDFTRAIVDSRAPEHVDGRWVQQAVRTVLAGARVGTLRSSPGTASRTGRGR